MERYVGSRTGLGPAVENATDEMTSRHEPQALTERVFPRDPYVAWLALREEERQREAGGSVRWVHRPRITDRPVGAAATE
jgi:hypothetical protein